DKIAEKFYKVLDEFNLNESICENKEDYEDIDLGYAKKIVDDIYTTYNVKSINSIKLSIGESARVLLRRKTRLLLVKDIDDENVRHIVNLAKEKNVKVETYSKSLYKAIALIDEGV
ncbi:MAG: RNA-binding protein, partial [Clostridium sp.]